MKRKYIMTIFTIIVLIGLIACGSNNTPVANETEPIKDELPAVETPSPDDMPQSQIDDKISPELENEDVENITEKQNLPIWYMDSEGIRNEEIGIIVRKDNSTIEELELGVNMSVKGSNYPWVFSCKYYDGDLDTYISEHTYEYDDIASGKRKTYTLEKGQIGDISYAYGNKNNNTEVIVAGNGIIVSTNLSTKENIEDYLENINWVESDEEANVDCLAYLSSDGLHCPALGIKFSCIGNDNKINSIFTTYYWENYTMLRMQDENIANMYYMEDIENAQAVVDKFVDGAIEPDETNTIEYSAIEEIAEINLGKFKYLGRGVIGQYKWDQSGVKMENWLFYSDDTTWSISILYNEGCQYEDYLGIIEPWE